MPMRVADYLAAPISCFNGRDVRVIGWQDGPPTYGLLPPGIAPAWLFFQVHSELWNAPIEDPATACGSNDCQVLFVHVPPSSPFPFTATHRWVVISGHREDPAAESCQWIYPVDWTDVKLSDEAAREQCRQAFVVTSVFPASAPRP
jgi:hypothetical protein